jgi:hypothetical protein
VILQYCSQMGHCCTVEQSSVFAPNIAETWCGSSHGEWVDSPMGNREKGEGAEWWWCSPPLWGLLLNLFSVPVNLHSVYRAVSCRWLLVAVTAFHPEDDPTFLPLSEFMANAMNTLVVLYFTSHNSWKHLNRSHQILEPNEYPDS